MFATTPQRFEIGIAMVDKFHPLTSILAGPGDDVLVSINDGPPVLLKNVAAGAIIGWASA